MISSIARTWPLVIIAFLLNACSNDSTSPNNDGNNEVDTGFRVIAVSQDTACWEEAVTVTLQNAQTDSFIAFVHSVPLVIDTSWRDNAGNTAIRFRVPIGASSGQLRIFEHDSIQAKTTRTLTVIPQRVHSSSRKIYKVSFTESYPGELLMIEGVDLPLRTKDLGVSLNGMPLKIVSHDSDLILARIAPNALSGQLSVRMFDTIYPGGLVDILEHDDKFLEDREILNIQIAGYDLLGDIERVIISSGDTLRSEQSDQLLSIAPYFSIGEAEVRSVSDSMICVHDYDGGSWTARLELRMKVEPDNRVSGVIRYSGESKEVVSFTELRIRNMRWWKYGSTYIIRAHSTDIGEQLVSYTSSSNVTNQDASTITYKAAERNAQIIIEIRE